MKILKIFGLVVGIHVFALILIFVNPGCSTASKPPPVPSDTVVASTPPPAVTVPNTSSPGVYTSTSEAPPVTSAPVVSAPVTFDPNAPASSSSSGGSATVRFTPTRPGTPVAATLVAEKVPDVTPATTYVVKPGDSLWSIAKRHKLTVGDLTTANGIAANANLQPGKKLLIPAKSIPASANAAAASAPAKSNGAPAVRPGAEGIKHTVKSGETLGSIARNYGVRQADIAVANQIADPAKIQAGMELVIPGWQATGSKAAKKGSGKSAPAAKTETGAEPPAAAPTPPPATANIPIIKIDESPVTPAPKP